MSIPKDKYKDENMWTEWYYSIRRDLNNTRMSAMKYNLSWQKKRDTAEYASRFTIFGSLTTGILSGIALVPIEAKAMETYLTTTEAEKLVMQKVAAADYHKLNRDIDEFLATHTAHDVDVILSKAHELQARKSVLDTTYNAFLPAKHIHFEAKNQLHGPRQNDEAEKAWTDRQRATERKLCTQYASEIVKRLE